MLDGPGTTGGGEFTIVVDATTSFLTFCLQRTEYINFVDEFHVDGISTYAFAEPEARGGDALLRDDLSWQTAFLYTQFRKGTLTGYDYDGPNQSTSADYLQTAIWMFEDELTMDDNNPYVLLAKDAIEDGRWDGSIGEVRALNLSFKDSDVEAQDQLMLVPSGTTTIAEVPEPASLLLFGSGMSVAAMVRRRKQRQSRSL